MQRLVGLLATAGVALMLGVIVSSAYLRLSQAGFSCSDWPACYGKIQMPVATSSGQIARFIHRIAASAVGIVLVAALLICVTQRPLLARQCAIVGAALAVALGLAALGSRSAADAVPSVATILANLGGGFTLLALTWWLRLSTLPRDPLAERSRPWLRFAAALALALAIGEIALGGLTSSKFAALACPSLSSCGEGFPARALLDAINPFAERVIRPDGAMWRPPELVALHWAHRLGALLLAMAAAAVALPLLRTRATARLGAAIGALLIAQFAVGAATVATTTPLVPAVAHNFLAALLLIVLISANRALYSRPQEGRPGETLARSARSSR